MREKQHHLLSGVYYVRAKKKEMNGGDKNGKIGRQGLYSGKPNWPSKEL